MASATATPSGFSIGTYRQLFIDGAWCDSSSGKRLKVINPATEGEISEVAFGGRADCKRAVEAAHQAMGPWAKLTSWDRAKILKKTADLMRDRADGLARTLTMEQGKPLAEAKAEVMHSADTFEWFAEEGKRAYGQVIPNSAPGKRHLTIKHPVGVVGAIGPWNFPITLQARKIAPALAVGCTIVCKPASQTPLSLINIFDCLIDAGMPPGVANLVMGSASEIAAEFLENPLVRKISFTGSTEVAVETARALKLGNGLDAGIEIGPMFEKKAMDNTLDLIKDASGKGAKILTGGNRSDRFEKGYFFEPTILRGLSSDANILTQEPFAPVMPILDFSKLDEVIAAANNTKYGLAAYVFTNDLTIAWKMAEGLEAGIIGVNDPVPATPQCPFGGMKESGMGRELAHEGLEAYLETKFISMKLRD